MLGYQPGSSFTDLKNVKKRSNFELIILSRKTKNSSLSFLLIKPDAVSKGHTSKIIEMVEKNGFEIIKRKRGILDRENVCFLYPKHVFKQKFFEKVVSFMTSGPSEMVALRRKLSAADLHKLSGATDPAKSEKGTLRNLFGTDKMRNAVHSSDNEENAVREIIYFLKKDAKKTGYK
jgi:nucleoside-diphosphate kinase